LTKYCPKVWENEIRQYRRIHNEKEWTKAKDIKEDMFWASKINIDSIPIPQMKKNNNKSVIIPIDERLMWLAGRYVGDGWTRIKDNRADLVITCGKNEVEYLKKKLNIWPRKSNRCKDGELSWTYRNVRTGGQFSTSNRELVKWLRNNFGHTALNKTIPSWLYGTKESYKRAFLSGYVSADGYICNGKVECSTISKKLAYGIRTLVVTMGYSPTIYLHNNVNNIIEGRIVKTNAIYKVKWKNTIDEKHKQTFVEDGYLWTRIKKVEKTGKLETFYNISVADDETYIAESIVVHNCRHFSKAKGGTPLKKEIRGLAWVTLRWASTVKPRVIILENVEEFKTWGPLRAKRDEKTGRLIVIDEKERNDINQKKTGRYRVVEKGEVVPFNKQLMEPDSKRKGQTYNNFIKSLEAMGYVIEYKELVAADFGVPTRRKRFYMIARCDGKPIVWPSPTHGPINSEAVMQGLLKPYVGAYTQLDFSKPCPSIFETAEEIKEKYGLRTVRPLAPKTMERIAKGIMKYVINNEEPFIVQVNHSGSEHDYCKSMNEPLNTITGKHGYGIIEPLLAPVMGVNTTNHPGGRVNDPLNTITSGGQNCLITPVLESVDELQCVNLIQYHEEKCNETRGQSVNEPIMTIDGANRYGLVTSFLHQYYSGGYKGDGKDLTEPLPTITAIDHNSICSATLIQLNNNCDSIDIKKPLPTITSGGGHFGEVRAFLIKYYGQGTGQDIKEPLDTITAKEKFGLIYVKGKPYQIVDIGLRMLDEYELAGCNGFPNDYILDRDYTGKVYPKSERVKKIGNAVCPPVAEALVRANLPELCTGKRMPNMQIKEENDKNGYKQLRFA